jgi:regulator of sigma E protease
MRTLKKAFLFISALELAFVIHEYGHYTELVKRDIPVQEFSLGIGPAIYQYEIGELTLSFRLLPIMAYVAPTEDGYKIQTESSNLDKFLISSAGVRNNLLSGIGTILFLNLISWRRGLIDGTQFIARVVGYPLKVIYIFILFFLDSLTLRKFSLGKNEKLYTGHIQPPKIVETFIYFSFFLGCLNFLPLYPLDGGRTFIEFASYFLGEASLAITTTASRLAMFFFFIYGVSEIKFVDYGQSE